MMKSFSVLAVFFLFGCASCGKIYLRLKYDVREFKPRSTEELLGYLSRKGIIYDQHFRIREEAFEQQQERAYKPGWKEGLRPVQLRAFDRTGSMIMQWAICEGFLDSMETLKSYPPVNDGAFVPMLLQDDLRQYADASGSSPDITSLPGFDLCMIVYWSRALGEMSLGSIRPVMAYREKHRDKRILLLLVSLDPGKGWKAGR